MVSGLPTRTPMPEFTHVGMVTLYQRGKAQGGPKAVQIRETKARWYDQEDQYGRWWPKESTSDNRLPVQSYDGFGVKRLDLTSIRPLTVAELREPYKAVRDRANNRMVEAEKEFAKGQKELAAAEADLEAFDWEHR